MTHIVAVRRQMVNTTGRAHLKVKNLIVFDCVNMFVKKAFVISQIFWNFTISF